MFYGEGRAAAMPSAKEPGTLMTAPPAPTQPGRSLPPRRVVILGASNVAGGLATVLATARQVWGAPLDVLAAYGHGRSYGYATGLPWYKLPAIVECGLWEALQARPPAPTAGLVTDVGNDLLYEAPVAEIATWVRTCVDRLLQAGARVTLTALPLWSIDRLSPRRFLFFRRFFFPACRLPFGTVVQRARELDGRLRELAKERSLLLVKPRPEWYGFDPIHIRRRAAGVAWHSILSRWSEGAAGRPVLLRRSVRRWLYLRGLAPEHFWLFGRERRQLQPVGLLADGTTLSLY
jgi:hypothetical protein